LLMIGEDCEPDWSANYITQYDEVIEWPFGDEQVLAHVTAALRLGTMQAKLDRRSEGLRSFGEKSANGWRTEGAVKPPHILLARGDAECEVAVEEALKGSSVLETASLGSNLLSTLNGSDVEFV